MTQQQHLSSSHHAHPMRIVNPVLNRLVHLLNLQLSIFSIPPTVQLIGRFFESPRQFSDNAALVQQNSPPRHPVLHLGLNHRLSIAIPSTTPRSGLCARESQLGCSPPMETNGLLRLSIDW